MPFRESPFDETLTPARWPAPDYTRDAEVSEAWLHPDEHAGWLVIQDDQALVFFSDAGPDRPAAYGVRVIVQDALLRGIAEDHTARETWDEIQTLVPFRAPEIRPLAPLIAQLRKAWE